MAARLKVFLTSDGLTDYVVATSSRAKALDAWGVRQDLFKTGAAHETDDPALAEAARARPGEVLRRPAGSREALARSAPPKARAKPAGPSKAALRKLEAAERRLADLDAGHARAMADIAALRADLEAREAREQEAYDAKRVDLAARLDAARRAAS